MDKSAQSTNKKQHIEKFKGKFEDIQGGCTVIINKTIQSIRDLEVLGVCVYLTSQPPEWEISAQQLANHFDIGINKSRRILTKLVDIGLLERISIKEKGKFIKHEYNLRLKPSHEFSEVATGHEQRGLLPLHGFREVENREMVTVKRKQWPNKTITSLKNKEEKKDAHATSTPTHNPAYQEYYKRIEADINLGLLPKTTKILSFQDWLNHQPPSLA